MNKKKFSKNLLIALLAAVCFTLLAFTVNAETVDSVTLKMNGQTVAPAEVLDNVVVYDVSTANRYTLTTTPDNTYGILFRVYFVSEWEAGDQYENGGYYYVTDYDLDITFDNVVVNAYDPRHGETEGAVAGRYAAVTFWAADMELNGSSCQEDESMAILLSFKGYNKIMLNGTEDAGEDEKWSAIGFANCCGNLLGEKGMSGELEAIASYDGAVGEVAAIRSTSGVNVGYGDSSVSPYGDLYFRATAAVRSVDGRIYGNGIDVTDYHFKVFEKSIVEIQAADIGILRRHAKYDGSVVFQDAEVRINAGNAAIINEGIEADHTTCDVRIYRSNVDIDGAFGSFGSFELNDPLDSGINAAGSIRFEYANVNVNAVNIALNTAYDEGGDLAYSHRTTLTIRNNSFVTVNGSKGEAQDEYSRDIAAIYMGGYYTVLYVENDCILNVYAGYKAIATRTLTVYQNAQLNVHTTEASGTPFGVSYLNANTDSNVYVESMGERLGITNAYIYSTNVFFYTASGAPASPNAYKCITAYNDIVVFESIDGENWYPVSQGRNSSEEMRYISTRIPGSHVCANDIKNDWVYNSSGGEDIHEASCLYCGNKITKACEFVYYNYYPTPTATKDGEISYRCSVGKNHYKDIIVPAHNCADYVEKWEDYGNTTRHCGDCTYFVEAAGIPCGCTVYVDHSFTEWEGDSLTVSRECTDCGRKESKSRHENVTHMEAIEGHCGQAGRIEFWHCTDADCGLYFADELMTRVVSVEETFTVPGEHLFGDGGICTVCGCDSERVTFAPYDEDYYSDNMDGELFIFVAFHNGKAYAMGHVTNPDGSREAVQIPVKENGAIEVSPDRAEFFAYDWDASTFSLDNGYMTMLDGKIVVYDKERLNEEGIPKPIIFSQLDYSEEGAGYFLNWTNKLYIVFDAETLTFKVTDEPCDGIIRYKQICKHQNIAYYPATDPTCTEQGVEEYWYCDDCYNYYTDPSLEIPAKGEDEWSSLSPEDFTIPALCHSFDEDGVCVNCSMKRNVYRPVTSLEQFDKLTKDAYFILVFTDGTKTYALYVPNYNYIPEPDADTDGNGIPDLLEEDADGNGIPDCIEGYIEEWWGGADADGDGITSADEYANGVGDWNEDGVIDMVDYQLFFENNMYWYLLEKLEEDIIKRPNLVEVTVADDGSITVIDEGAMEFQMMPSGVWGGQPNEDGMLKEYGITENDRLRAMWIPNYWVANDGSVGEIWNPHLMQGNRVYGDGEYPGIIDNKNWKISFDENGNARFVCGWTDFDDTTALCLVKYMNAEGMECLTIVGMYGSQWEYSEVMANAIAIYPATLYASEPDYGHVHVWGEWEITQRSHVRYCTEEGCDAAQSGGHYSPESVIEEQKLPTCTEDGYTVWVRICDDCGYEYGRYEETVSATGHVRGQSKRENVVEPTCTEDGSHDVVSYCAACGVELARTTLLDEALGHEQGEPVFENIVEATCAREGSEDIVFYCVRCGVEISRDTQTYDKLEHVMGEPVYDSIKPATCTEAGVCIETISCTACGEEISRNELELEPLGHVAGEAKTSETAPTCTYSGSIVTAYYCEVCGEWISGNTVIIPALGHEAGNPVYENVVEATCTEDGGYQEVIRCIRCDAILQIRNVTEPATGHTEGETTYEVIEPTCTSTGVTSAYRHCATCGKVLGINTHTYPALGHEGGEPVIEEIFFNKPTCTEDGKGYEVVYCIRCDEQLSRDPIVLEALGHEAGNPVYENVVEATCISDGSYQEVIYCTRCDAILQIRNATEPATGHTLGEPVVEVIDPTCTSEGITTTRRYCTVCGSMAYNRVEKQPMLGHEGGEPVIEEIFFNKPTCTEDGKGYEVVYCIRCDEQLSRDPIVLEALGHEAGNPVYENVVEATCISDGSYQEVIYCTRCDAILQIRNATEPATGHTLGDPVVEVIDPTCTSEGVTTTRRYCTVCGSAVYNRVEKQPMLGHEGGEPVIEEVFFYKPTCTEDGKGYEVVDCIRCNKELSRTPIVLEALGHEAGEVAYENVVEATCTEDGGYQEVIRCTRCDAMLQIRNVTEPATGHTLGDWQSEGDTMHARYCLNGCGMRVISEHSLECKPIDGYKHYVKCFCGYSAEKEHTLELVAVILAPTHVLPGLEEYRCTVCECSFFKELPQLPDHEWGDWTPDEGEKTHSRYCDCGITETEDCVWDEGDIIEYPTHEETGIRRHYCTVCSNCWEAEIPVITEHVWFEWIMNKMDMENTHIRYCYCGETEVAPHNMVQGSAPMEGVNLYYCTDCGYSYEERAPIAEGKCGEETLWKLLDNGTLVIYGNGSTEDYLVNIAKDQPYRAYQDQITKVVIEEGVLAIGRGAFYGFTNMTEVVLPESLIAIHEYAFFGCTGITSIDIPAKVFYIGSYAFRKSGVTAINFADESGWAFVDGTSVDFSTVNAFTKDATYKQDCLKAVDDNGTVIVNRTFGKNDAFTWTLTDTGVLTINGKGSMPKFNVNTTPWYGYRGAIRSVVIEEGVTSVGRCSFHTCRGIVSITLPESIETIAEYAFYNCPNVKSVEIPANVTTIEAFAFRKCKQLTDVTFGISYGWSAGGEKISATEIIKSGAALVTTVYYNDVWSRDINAEEEVLDPNYVAGGACNSYTKWTLTYIDEARTQMKLTVSGNGIMPSYGTAGAPWYGYLNDIVEIEVGEGITEIGRCAFYGLKFVTKVTLPSTLTTIGDYAFNGCFSLKTIEIPKSVTHIGTDAFKKTGLSEIPTV